MNDSSPTGEFTVQPEDAGGKAAQGLIEALCAELSQHYDKPPSPFSPAQVGTPGTVFLVARRADEPVGCGALRRLSDTTVELKRMYVAPAARRQGLARRILDELERHAIAFGYRAIRLETGIHQHAAIALYESRGYRHIDRFGPYIGSSFSVCFEKILPS